MTNFRLFLSATVSPVLAALLWLNSFTPVGNAQQVDEKLLGEGFDVGNGGDVIICRHEGDDKDEMYSLDFLLFSDLNEIGPSSDITDVHFENILAKLQTIHPAFHRSMKQFVDTIFNRNPAEKFLWIPSSLELIDITDEGLIALLPEGCHTENGQLQIKQAVIRVTNEQESAVNFYYEKAVLTQLQVRFPLQFSFLMIHEFLWEFFADSEIHFLRSLNQYLHSADFLETNAEEFSRVLRRFGVEIENDTDTSPIGTPINLDPEEEPDNHEIDPPVVPYPEVNPEENQSLDYSSRLICAIKSDGRPFCTRTNAGSVDIDLAIRGLRSIAVATDFGCGLTFENKAHCFGPFADKVYKHHPEFFQRNDLRRMISSKKAMICFETFENKITCVSSDPEYVEIKPFKTVYQNQPVDDIALGYGNHCIKEFGQGRCWSTDYQRDLAMKAVTETIDFSNGSEITLGNYSGCSLNRGKLTCGYNASMEMDHFQKFYLDLTGDEIFEFFTIGSNHFCYREFGGVLTCNTGTYQLNPPPLTEHISFFESVNTSFCFLAGYLEGGNLPRCYGSYSGFEQMIGFFNRHFGGEF